MVMVDDYRNLPLLLSKLANLKPCARIGVTFKLEMEIHKLISDILEGKVRVLSFDNVALGPDQGIAASALCALNFARLAFAAEASSPVLSNILSSLSSRKTVENAIAVCRKWSSDAQLELEDLYRIPLFEATLKLVSTDHTAPTADHVAKLLENLRTLNTSAAMVITSYPDIVTCLRLRTSAQEIFVLFNPRVASGNERIASLTFSSSLSQIVQRLCDLFPTDWIHISQENRNLDRQHLLEKCAGHVFVSRVTTSNSRVGEDSLAVASLTLLALKAELGELTRHHGDLKVEKQKLERNVIDLRAQLDEERARPPRARSFRPSEVKTSGGAPAFRIPQSTRSPRATGERQDHLDNEDEIDPSMEYALRLQATFDSENDLLMRQKGELMQTAQRQYHCGVCLDDFPEDDAVRIDACSHEICRTCAHGHVCTKIEEHRFPVLCPVCMADDKNQRPGVISGSLVQLLGVSEKQWETWVEMELAQFSIPFTCRKCCHSAFVDRQDLEASPEIHCPFLACNHVWCKKCQQTINPKGPKHSCDGTSELDHLMKQQGWRYCPNCKTPIQKSYGCNHLSCIAPGCNTHFCYGCGSVINRTAVPREIQQGKTAHFRTCPIT